MGFKEIKKGFDELDRAEQWAWLVNTDFKDRIIVVLDNDMTMIQFHDDKEWEYVMYFKDDIGDRNGVSALLEAIGINSQYV